VPSNPWIYAVNAQVLLRRLSSRSGQITLAGVPDDYWGRLGDRFNLVWLLGVWERSPAAREEALTDPGLRRAYSAALADRSAADVGASPYAVRRYRLEPTLGRTNELALVHERLRRNGLGLLLDFVSNHVARDHPWTTRQPEYFVRPTATARARHPEWFFEARPGLFLAHGRDPYFAPWTDTAQFDFNSPELRRALIGELLTIARVSDGVRCDMAMLALSDIHADIWRETGERKRLASEFWTEAIATVRRQNPGFLFIAEAYWGLGPKLIELGFDYVYDKELYDALRAGAPAVQRHLASDALGAGALRFIENHDEDRAANVFALPQALAATAIIATLPGALLINDGQPEGRRKRVPVQLLREPEEPADLETAAAYGELFDALKRAPIGSGVWTPLRVEARGRPQNPEPFAWRWDGPPAPGMVLVNYSPETVAAVIHGGQAHEPTVPVGGGLRHETGAVAQEEPKIEASLRPWEVRVVSMGA